MRQIGLALKIINHSPVSSDIISSSKAALFHFMDIIKDFGGTVKVERRGSLPVFFLTRIEMNVFGNKGWMDGHL